MCLAVCVQVFCYVVGVVCDVADPGFDVGLPVCRNRIRTGQGFVGVETRFLLGFFLVHAVDARIAVEVYLALDESRGPVGLTVGCLACQHL